MRITVLTSAVCCYSWQSVITVYCSQYSWLICVTESSASRSCVFLIPRLPTISLSTLWFRTSTDEVPILKTNHVHYVILSQSFYLVHNCCHYDIDYVLSRSQLIHVTRLFSRCYHVSQLAICDGYYCIIGSNCRSF